ncbi:SDR family oxidoreductase [Streptomyces sp. NPDC026673]|uniref:SDR family oxidoreductase n=1 Tax=Streptomyces sp. NPDC026673 TaxID=3155724 RepID=UPI0033EC10A1
MTGRHGGRIALVTGASRGIGAATARLPASRGIADVLGDPHRKHQAAQTVLGRMAKPDDVARAVAFYAGDDSGFITGAIAGVNGGGAWD